MFLFFVFFGVTKKKKTTNFGSFWNDPFLESFLESALDVLVYRITRVLISQGTCFFIFELQICEASAQ